MANLDTREALQPRARYPPRCGACKTCRLIKRQAAIYTPQPYSGKHATDESVGKWNQLLFDNPCERWKKEVCHDLSTAMLKISETVRPKRKTIDGRQLSRLVLRKR